MGKVVLVTGSSSGFGKLTALTLAKKGYTVYASMRNTQTNNLEVATELEDMENIHTIDLDVTSDDSVKRAVKAIREEEGRIDVVFNNAGMNIYGIGESYTSEDLKRLFDVNVFGMIRVNNAVLPSMRWRNEGLIIHTDDILGTLPLPLMTAYCATKTALDTFVRGYQFELQEFKIDIVEVQPGPFPTEMNSKAQKASNSHIIEFYPKLRERKEARHKLMEGLYTQKNAPDPQMVADKVLQICEMEAGTRPLRVVVDPISGQMVQEVNALKEKYEEAFIKGFFSRKGTSVN